MLPLAIPLCASEAVDWILRVTGKDGGGGGDRSEDLAKAITQLPDFSKAITAATEKLKESGGHDVNVPQIIQNLTNYNQLGPIVKILAEGLSAFIGYGRNGEGIADLVDPLQQLRKGVLMFIKTLLDKFRTSIDKDGGIFTAVGKAIRNTGDFESAIQRLSGLTDGPIKGVVDALKNISSLRGKKDVQQLAEGFKAYLAAVLGAVVKDGKNQVQGEVNNLKGKLESLITTYGNKGDISRLTGDVKDANTKLDSKRRLGHPAQPLIEGTTRGTENLLTQLKKDGYKSAYMAHNWNGTINNGKMAQIFLGCLPLYYYWLTYLHWKCREKEGEWATQWFNGRAGGTHLKSFMTGQGYVTDHLGKQKGSEVATLLQSLGISSVTTTQHSHTALLSALDNSLQRVIGAGSSSTSTNLNDHSLSALFYLCRCYFTGKQSMQSVSPTFKPRPPTSIREMLYWLSGLQFSPHYSSIEQQIDAFIPHDQGLHVADSSAKSKDPLTRNQMKGYLKTSCLSAPSVLGVLQGTGYSTENPNEPWLYSLFCNSAFQFKYPSGSALVNALSRYSYALQFQLYFLYRQCQNNYSYTCGWNECRYGSGVAAAGLTSHLCPKGCSRPGSGHNRDDHSGCKHDDCSTQGSPLQAFLTDNLKGFCRQQPGTSYHLTECSDGSMCHTPMGFTGKLRTDAGGGLNIAYALNPFCGGPSDPLRQLSEKLGCLTKRTPRTLGDLLGFLWHLNGQLFKTRPRMGTIINAFIRSFNLGTSLSDTFNNDRYSAITSVWQKLSQHTVRSSPSSSGLALSLEAMAPQIPFLHQLFMAEEPNTLPGVLFDLTKHCHKREAGERGKYNVVHKSHSGSSSISGHRCSEPSDLWSIFQGLDTKPSGNNTDKQAECRRANCGGYLSPLTHTYGATYSPNFASTYLSWVVYLVEVFNERLHELLVEFNDINCKDCGPHCSCTKGQHGSTNCSCASIVQCGGVLPVLYTHGFNFTNAFSLKGGTHGNDPMKRNCKNFQTALSNILKAEAPLHTLLTTIDDVLYMFRIYFFYNLSTFWIMYVCIVLYIYFLRADLLHVKSHVRFPSSHGIPPITVLTMGKAPSITKLTYFMP